MCSNARAAWTEVPGMGDGASCQSPPGERATWLRPLVDAIDATMKTALNQEPFQHDPRAVRLMVPLITAINSYFGAEIRGWENLPKDGPMLIVGNHSGGAQTIDVAPLLGRWMEDRGAETPLYMLGYDLLFAYPIVGRLWRKLGLLRADPGIAEAALRRGAATVVFPGGDYEVFRPWSERNKIDFGGHTGFIKLALAARVPVIPMTIHGAHQSTIVLTRGHTIAHWMGLDRLHIKVFPFIWNIPLGVTPAFVPSLQLPAKVTVQFGAPLDWSHYRPEKAKDPKVVRRCSAEITGVMQKTLDALARERPHPVLARLDELRPSHILRHLLRGATDGGGSALPSRQPGETRHVVSPGVREHRRASEPSQSRQRRAVRPHPASTPIRLPGGVGTSTSATLG
jgi:1-acyl-sn-glycerol-3-phosphate acyltransferase